MKLGPTAEQEREFEKQHISKLKKDYLETDVVERCATDPGYAEKVAIMQDFLERRGGGGLTLDVGSNTAGETEMLAHKGFDMVATDINEIALAFSLNRASRYRERRPSYVAGDAHRLPFADGSFDAVTAFEVLHHFENLAPAMSEIYRILRPGGHLFAYEPYALNPYRRLAELRFYLKGSIEKSFTESGLRKQMEQAGFEILSVRKNVLRPSTWKMDRVGGFRRFLKKFYYAVSRRIVPVFGSLVFEAVKPGSAAEATRFESLDDRLRCPITWKPLRRASEGYYETEGDGENYRYRIHEGVPVIIREDAEKLG